MRDRAAAVRGVQPVRAARSSCSSISTRACIARASRRTRRAAALYALIAALPGVTPGGLHAYDGHIRDADVTARAAASDAAFEPVARLAAGAGGAPACPCRGSSSAARRRSPFTPRRPGVELSPGTCIFWDAGYGSQLPDLPFRPAALVLTRVVSRPGAHRLCLDLGHKAIASENPHPRVQLLNLPDATPVMHSEEHLVVETPHAGAVRCRRCLLRRPVAHLSDRGALRRRGRRRWPPRHRQLAHRRARASPHGVTSARSRPAAVDGRGGRRARPAHRLGAPQRLRCPDPHLALRRRRVGHAARTRSCARSRRASATRWGSSRSSSGSERSSARCWRSPAGRKSSPNG